MLAPEHHPDCSRHPGPLIERPARAERRRIQVKADRRAAVARILHPVEAHRIYTRTGTGIVSEFL